MTTVDGLQKKIAGLPAEAELRDFNENSRWDVYLNGVWLGGLPFDDEQPFYTAESAYERLAPKVYKGGDYDRVMSLPAQPRDS